MFSSNGTQIQVNHDVYFSGTEKKSGFDITIPYTEVVTSKYSFEQKSDRDDDFSVVYGRIRYDSKLVFYHNGMIDGEVQDLVNKELRGSVAISKAKDGATVIEFLMPVRKSTTGKIYIYFKTDKSFVSQPISGLIEFKYYTVPKGRRFLSENAGTIGKWTMGGVFLAAGATVAIIAAPAVLTATAVGGAVAGVLGGTLTGMEIGEIVGNEVQDRIKDSIQEIKNKYSYEQMYINSGKETQKIMTINLYNPKPVIEEKKLELENYLDNVHYEKGVKFCHLPFPQSFGVNLHNIYRQDDLILMECFSKPATLSAFP